MSHGTLAEDQADNKDVAVVRRLFEEVFRQGNLAVADEILTPDFTLHYPFPGFPPGIDGLKRFVSLFHSAFPGFELEIQHIFGVNGRVAVHWTARGTHKGDFLGIPPSNAYLNVVAIGIYNNCPPHCSGGGSEVVIESSITVVGVGDLAEDAGDVSPSDVPASLGAVEDVQATTPKIAEGWLVMDSLNLLQQIGAIQPVGEILPGLRT